MEFKHLPDSLQQYWSSLSYDEQRQVLTCLGQNFKPLKYILRVPATIPDTAKALRYLDKHKIPYEAKAVGKKVHFIFNAHGLRNEVLIGMNCL